MSTGPEIWQTQGRDNVEDHPAVPPRQPRYQPGAGSTWYVVPDYRPNGDPATSATVVDRAGQQIAHFERIADAEIAVEAVNRNQGGVTWQPK